MLPIIYLSIIAVFLTLWVFRPLHRYAEEQRSLQILRAYRMHQFRQVRAYYPELQMMSYRQIQKRINVSDAYRRIKSSRR